MNKKWILPALLLFLFLLIPIIANAHVKWFTEVQPKKESIENISFSFIYVSFLLLSY